MPSHRILTNMRTIFISVPARSQTESCAMREPSNLTDALMPEIPTSDLVRAQLFTIG